VLNINPSITINRIRFKKSTIFAINKAIIFAFMVIWFPWQFIMRVTFEDFETSVEYYNRVTTSMVDIYQLTSILSFLSFEIVWNYFMISLTATFGSPEIALRTASFFILFIWGLFLFRKMPFLWALFFLINPSSIEISMSIIRNGFAWSLIILAMYMISNKWIRYLLYAVSPFVHISSVGFLFLYYSSKKIIASTNSKNKQFFLIGSIAVLLGLSISVFPTLIYNIIPDRRFAGSYAGGGGSLLQMLFFIILLFVQIRSGKKYIAENIFVIGLIIWYLTMNPFVAHSHRLWSASIPLLAYSIWNLPVRKRQLILFLWSGYVFLWYLYWSKLFYYWYPA